MHEALLDLPFPHYGASDFFILLQYSRLSTYVPIASLSDDRSAASPFAHCGRYQPCQRCAKPSVIRPLRTTFPAKSKQWQALRAALASTLSPLIGVRIARTDNPLSFLALGSLVHVSQTSRCSMVMQNIMAPPRCTRNHYSVASGSALGSLSYPKEGSYVPHICLLDAHAVGRVAHCL
jgi:hypothetical protein